MTERDRPVRTRYRFPPLERRGVIAGWRGGQIAAVAAGLVFGVLALRSQPTIGGVLMAVVFVGVGMGVAFWPIQGRTGEQWFPLVVRWLWASSTGNRRQLAPGPRAGHRADIDPGGPGRRAVGIEPPVLGVPGLGRRAAFDGVRVVGVPIDPGGPDGPDGPDGPGGSAPASGELGIVVDGPARTATAALSVRGHSFALLGPDEQDSTIAAWARVLSAMAREGSGVHRLQWIESCVPDDGGAVRRHWMDHAVLGSESPAGRSYRTLVDESSPVTRRHRVVVALSIHTAHTSRAIRASGGGTDGIGVVLGRELLSLQRALDGANLTVDGALGPGALRRLIGGATAPTAGPGATGTGPDQKPGPPGPGDGSWPWPMAVEAHWDAVHTDATWHATYWIAEWPRVDVTPDFLGPLLFSPLRRTITLVMEPVSPSRAARQVAQARTADIADGELRRRGGFLTTARHARVKESVEERDVELADGHAVYRFSGYVTVTTDTRAELASACAAVEQAAGQARVDLRLLYGEQDLAFTCSLPLGRGLS